MLELGDGMRIVAPANGGHGGGRITVRPEKIRIGTELEGDCSRIGGRVIEQVYLGSLSQTVVETVTGERLIVHELNDDERPPAMPGDEVVLSWHARHSLIVDERRSP